MHKKLTKALTGSIMAAAMAATSVAGVMAPMSANAGQLLGATDFEDGVGLPWHTCETNPAKQKFDIVDGAYTVTIKNNMGGNGRWDLQLRHRGLTIKSGHKYHIHAEITPSADGEIYSKIGNYAGTAEYWNDTGNGNWQVSKVTKGQTFEIDCDFTAGSGPSPIEDGPAEWAFHYACHAGTDGAALYGGTDKGMPNDSTLTFDNMSLEDLSGSDGDFDPSNEFGVIRPKTNVRLNQVGYYQGLRKRASYTSDASEPLEFDVYNSSGTSVYTGKSTIIKDDYDSGTPKTTTAKTDGGVSTQKYKDSGEYVHILDFTELQTGGTGYYIIVKDKTGISGTQSGIKKNAYDTTISGDKVMWTNWKTGKEYQMNRSHPFAISDTLYDGLLRDSMSYFYQNRSGIPIEAEYIKNGDAASLSHSQYGHSPDTAYVQSKWIKSYSGKFDGDEDYQITATGGWYDAGDHGKYVVNGGVSIWTLQNMYEMSKNLGKEDKWADGKSMLIPQTGSAKGSPDALDEARVELEWFFDMMVDSKDPYFGKDAGLVYHKLHDHKWTGLAIHAWKYEGFEDMTRIVKPPTYAATFNMVACAAQAARLWEGIDDDFAATCLKNAKTGLAAAEKLKDNWYNKNGTSAQQDDVKGTNAKKGDVYFAPLDQAIGGGPYGDTYVTDDYYWALCELFATTGDEEYYTKLMDYKNSNDSTGADKALSLTSNLGGGENKGSFSSFNWGCTSGLGTLSLYLNSDKLSDADAKTVKDSIIKAADNYIEQEDKSGMGIPYVGSTFTDEINIGLDDKGNPIEVSGYEWGSNSFVANNAIVMAYAYDATKTPKYLSGATTAMDYIFGRNGNDFSYVSGYGDVESGSTLQWPHHRLWANGVDPDFPKAPAGVMSGGPGAGMQDPYVGGLGFKRGTLASQKCYVDSAEAWSVNEITINWNAPLAWMASYLEDVAPGVKEGDPVGPGTQTTPGTTTTKANTTTSGATGDTLYGDANVDGKVTVADATAILQSIANSDKYALKAQGKINADVVDGDGVTSKDALAIQMMDAQLIKQADFPTTSAKLDALK
ncbi:MAG: glycoside hydrolase family 9 protein [Ruminococcus sp.]|nr:glycoside hydrolase family 9 protein [Ruminococcus sp.]